MLDEPLQDEIDPCQPPEPCPPVSARPQILSVTDIGTWQRNPYAIYAKHILKLRKLDPLAAPIDASDRGNLIHKILETFIRECPDPLPRDALDRLLAIGSAAFAAYDEHAEVKAFWWPRFERIAAWFIAEEAKRRALGVIPFKVEASGQMAFGDFTLKGRADRVDRNADGVIAIIDYKTGSVPKKAEVEAGYEPQLPLLGLMAERGGFDGVPAGEAGAFAYWKLAGGHDDDSNKITAFNDRLDELIAEAEAGLLKLIAEFAKPDTAYQAVPKPGQAPRHDDYAHLARLAEWGRTQGE